MLLESYVRRELTLVAAHDQLSLSLQSFTENASDDDLGLLSEVLSALYEVEDGVLDEETFRRAVGQMVTVQLHSPTITVGDPMPSAYPPYLVGTLTTSSTLQVVYAA
jgi:hypothetical protein